MMQYNSSNFLIEYEVPSTELIISRTDLNGNITFANEMFLYISGYNEDELIGKPHSILRHPDMPKAVFSLIWKRLLSGRAVSGIIKNLAKDGRYYWVIAELEPKLIKKVILPH